MQPGEEKYYAIKEAFACRGAHRPQFVGLTPAGEKDRRQKQTQYKGRCVNFRLPLEYSATICPLPNSLYL